MTSWISWLSDISRDTPVGTLVYVGSDHPDILRTLPGGSAERLVVANANPSLRDELAELAERREGMLFHPKALGEDGQGATFHDLSLPGLSGLAAPRDVLDLFPGLSALGTAKVGCLPLPALMADAPRKSGAARVLRLELAGAETRFLADLAALPDDALPDHVLLRLPVAGLYADTPSQDDVLAALKEAGYALRARSEDDPDFPEYWLGHDADALQIKRNKDALSKANAELEALIARLEERETALEELRTAAKVKEAEANTLRADLDEQGKALEAAMAATAAKQDEAESLIAHLEQRERALETSQAAAKAREDEAETLRNTLGERDKALEAANAAAKAKEDEAASLRNTLGERDKALEEAQEFLESKSRRVDELGRALLEYEARAKRTLGQFQQAQNQLDAEKTASAELKAQLGSEKAALTELKTQLDAEKTAHNELKAQLDAQKAAQADLKTQLGAVQTARDELKTQLSAERTAAAELKKQLDAEKAAQTGLKAQLDAEKAARAEQAKRLEASDAARQTIGEEKLRMQQEVDAALRLQYMARSDIQELRQRYEALSRAHETQSRLIQTIMTRLQPAAEASSGEETGKSKRSDRTKGSGKDASNG
ncbi:coiled-coil domain-containing protein [Salipiger aestuarii]|uniref:hypothetical protein n=1 Tax=Salipiger aestuarii TaxID=568098 RepID=UPI001239F76F|nr:hypothetical protein [Salipiger aestuarii]KAA8610027.1 hypothetical protein AL037_14340 [Salipiger aestuarii]